MKGLANMKELRFLHVDCSYVSEDEVSNWNFDEVDLHLPNALRFLSWLGYPFSSLPKTFQAKNLVGLEMELGNLVQLWKDGEEKVFYKLRFLKFMDSNLRTLDLGLAPNLEMLHLQECYRLEELHMPAESPKLKFLTLSFSSLTTLELGITPNLETLSLENCTDMVELKTPAECPKLVHLELIDLKLKTLHLGITPNLETLSLDNCTDMVELKIPVECPKLVNLKLRDLKLTTLDLGIAPNLETLSLHNCMVELQIPAECSNLTKLRTLDLGLTPNLESLNLEYCYDLEEINAPAECLKKLLYLDISHCGRFESFKFEKELDSLEVVSLSELHLIADDTGICDPDNTWPDFQFSCYYKEDPASSFGNLERLISLGFVARINVDSFSDIICGLQCLRKLTLEGGIPEAPKNLDQLDCLEELSLLSTDIKTLPHSICMLKHLKSLKLESCLLLEELPVDIGRFECLESLILSKCTLLQDLPNSIYEMKCLKSLQLTYCIQVEELPEAIGRLDCLKELNILGSGISHLPHSLYGLRGLRIIGDRRLLESCGLTPKRRRMSDEDSNFSAFVLIFLLY
ncbi:disease resistance TIR-NBS-LRR class family protein [Tanacetum coccineum]